MSDLTKQNRCQFDWHKKCFLLLMGVAMLTDSQYQLKWKEIKDGMHNLWSDISDEELEMVRDNLFEITTLLENRFGETKVEISQKIQHLLESFDNDTDKNLDPDVSSYHRSP